MALTNNQEKDEAVFRQLLERIGTSDDTGFLFRPEKLKAQLRKYDICFMDVRHALNNKTLITRCEGPGSRYEIEGPSIDGKDLVITLAIKGNLNLKILNVWGK